MVHSWSIKMTTADFGVSEHAVREGGALQKTCGILPEDENKRDQLLSVTVTQTVIQFCQNDPCPDKDCVKQQLETSH
jgi:hypothetical protein